MNTHTLALFITCALLAGGAGLYAARLWFSPDDTRAAAPVLEPMLAVGDLRADLRMPDSDGAWRQLAEFDGQTVLLNFWATWCAPCRKEMPALQAVQDQLGARGLQIVGIALDRPDDVRKFLAEHAIRYPNLLGQLDGKDPSRLYGNTIGVLPYSVLIDRDGRIHATHVGDLDEPELRAWVEPLL